MTTKTTYRILRYGRHQFLEYLKSYKLFFFFKFYAWEKIHYPSPKGHPQVVCTLIPEYSKNVKKFVLKYPDIDEYFKTEYVERKAALKENKR